MAGMAMDLRIGVLGPLEVRVGFGEPVQMPGPRLRALVIRLALEPDRLVLASQLIDAVWDSDPPADATGALQSLVSRLRRLLPEVIDSQAAGYRLAVDPEAVDAVRFERLALEGRRELAGDPGRARELLCEALSLWRGPALADVATARFAGAAVARLEELRLGAVEDRIDAELRTGAAGRLVAELDELVAAHPLRERLHGQLIRALAGAGRQADALGAYQRLRDRLADELGIDPSEELQAIHLAVLRGERAPGAELRPPGREPEPRARTERRPADGPATAPATTGEPARTNLRAQITSFVGRDADIARIAAVLGDARLATLTGPGGSGKTRLANEAAATLVGAMPDGVWLAELGPVVDPVDLPQAVLSLFGARELGLLARRGARGTPGPAAPQERIVDAIGDKQLLLVMDNCEHLVTPAAALIDLLLARCPRLRVLATSREPLGITGEVLHPVGPLGMPAGEVAPAEALGFPAVRLLADRGAAARPGFAVDQRTLAAVLDICRRLDGIPLAIELAAARLRALSPEQIAARLDDRFRLLAGGSRAALPRHQTLRAVVDWSWDLLSDPERVLARRLAVFPGGATLEAAERVCAGQELGGLDRDEVLWLLAALVEKSLVVTAEDGAGVRYSMLETMRAYGLERRQEAGEEAALRRAHADHFLALAEEAEPHLRRAEQLDWIHRLTAERENLHGALRWAIDSGDAELAMRLVAAVAWFWFLQSARAEGAQWARQALAMPGQVSPVVRAQGYVAAALTVLSGGEELQGSLEYLDRAIAVVAEAPHGDPRMLHPMAELLPVMRNILLGQDEAALELVEPMETNPDPWVRALAPFLSAQLLINFGEGRRAAELLDQAVERFRALGERWGTGQSLFARVDLSAYSADQRIVIPALVEAKDTLATLGDREDVGHVLGRLAWARALAGDLDGARRDVEEAERITRSVGATEERLYLCWVAGQIARRADDPAAARAWLDQGIEASMEGQHPYGQLHSSLLTVRGYLDLDSGDVAAARQWCERSLVVALRTRDRPVMARARELLAAVELAEGRAERAAELLGNAAKLRGMPDEVDPDVRRVRAAARAALGDEGYALATERGTAPPREDLEAALAADVTSGAGTPAGPAARTPRR
jgi:predicted ATPase